MLQEVSSDDVGRYQSSSHSGSNGHSNGHSPQRPPLPKKQQSGHSFHPMEDWLPSAADHHGVVGLSHAGRDRRRRELMEHGSPSAPLLPMTEQKGGNAMERRRAIQATIWSFIATAVFAFGFVLPYRGTKDTLDFITGFLVEKSLSVDNLFVFLMIFEYFKVPEHRTERVLRWGILTALVLRGVMIAIGVAAVERFRPVLLAFAVVLIVSAVKMLQPEGEDEDLKDNMVMKIARRLVNAQDEYDGEKFVSRSTGVRRATPMLVVLVCLELSDVIFAVDSIPAVVGITQDPFIVYSSNIFALMALRSLYLILSKSVQQLIYLKQAVATILGFVGVKMVLEYFHFHVSSFFSLSVIILLLAAGTLTSLHHNRTVAANGGGAAAPNEGIGSPRRAK